MNNPNPFVPKGSLLEQQSQRRSRLKLAVFCVVLVSVSGLVAMLIQGCKREQPATDSNLAMDNSNPPPTDYMNPPPDTNSNVPVPPPMSNPPSPIVVPPAPAPQVPVGAAGSEYIVVQGDTLGKIAKAKGVSLNALEAANSGVDSKKLKIKQKLVIPAATTPGTGTTTATAETGSDIYVVKPGDTLTKIAKAHGTTINAIKAANPNVDPNHIKPNQKLKMPAKAEAAAPVPVQTAPAMAEPTAPMPVPVMPGMTN